MARGWNEEDPEKGVPNRHTRAKIRLLLDCDDPDEKQLLEILLKIAEKRPGDVLDAVLEVMGEDT